jgi:hypothetical protein
MNIIEGESEKCFLLFYFTLILSYQIASALELYIVVLFSAIGIGTSGTGLVLKLNTVFMKLMFEMRIDQ